MRGSQVNGRLVLAILLGVFALALGVGVVVFSSGIFSGDDAQQASGNGPLIVSLNVSRRRRSTRW